MKKYTTDEFVDMSINTHKNKYDYSLVEYINNRTKIKIICPIHGIFEQYAGSHIRGFGCSKCAMCHVSNNIEFIEKSRKINNNKYTYDNVEYVNAHTKVIVTCQLHGDFLVSPNKHLSGSGCPICCDSKSEKIITKYLSDNNKIYERQKKFVDCKNIKCLPFDFYLPKINTCIEFDGEQHYIKHNIWGEEKLKRTQIHDQIKNIYCVENNIKLLRISYKENIIDKIEKYINI
ncbi:hypothetical protein M0Q50_10610 [bacterium]|jgi:hypothetical protein|nr:hypothetical protein [bacterium]